MKARIQSYLDAVINNPNIEYSHVRYEKRIASLEEQLKEALKPKRPEIEFNGIMGFGS